MATKIYNCKYCGRYVVTDNPDLYRVYICQKCYSEIDDSEDEEDED